MGLMSRNKGKRGEREVAHLLQTVADRVAHNRRRKPLAIQRNTLQSDAGGFDLSGVPGVAIEVKHCETLALDAWWEQTVEQASGESAVDGVQRVPVLIYRQNRRPWRVRMNGHVGGLGPGAVPVVADISCEAFLTWFERHLNTRAHLVMQPLDRSA